MQTPRWTRILLVVLLILGSFFVSFLVGQRMLSQGRLSVTEDQLSKLPKPNKVEVYLPKISEEKIVPVTPQPLPTKLRPLRKVGVHVWGGYTVQVGAFRVSRNARAMRTKLRRMGYNPAIVKRGSVYNVRVSRFVTLSKAKMFAQKLHRKGLDAVAIRD